MKLSTKKNGFLGADQTVSYEASYQKAKAVIIPFGMENHVSYGEGTRRGPQAIINASHQINENDEQTFKAIYRCGIATLTQPQVPKKSTTALNLLAKITQQVLKDGKFPVILGGEHALTPAVLWAVCKKYSDISVLHFDAHADLRSQYEGSIYSHASALRRVLETCPVQRLVQVGIRSVSEVGDELGFMRREKKRIKTFWGWQDPPPQRVIKAISTKNVYITFDVDAFDSSLMPATGTPEPGGLQWWPTLEILKAVFAAKNVVGVDLVELAPIPRLHAPDFLAARLVYKMIGYKFSGTRIKAT